ncbi:TetR/AcrR family transcriptional regulator [Bacillus sp. FJAT-45350]|uniref:TetR/AcrR family transcriptional regulator n=1 Tax=Bacillus sp. FJAT-45350 TaxID=2011014 RepID=UPI0015CC624F|nr:TetR/AcrR family transcriptional regulator [Bacillus sp. FJAT-45350]
MQKKNKCEQILLGAANVFLDVGFERATIQEIAVRSGVGKGTIYEYFSSKEDLFIQFVKEGVSYVFDQMLQCVESANTFNEMLFNLKKFARELMNKNVQKIAMLWFEFKFASESLSKWVLEQDSILTEKTAAAITELMEKGEVRQVNPSVAASMILDIIRISFYYKLTNTQQQLSDIIDAKIDILNHGLLSK